MRRDQFISIYGMSPEKMEEYLLSNEVSRTMYSSQMNLPKTTVLRHFGAFGIKGYEKPKKVIRNYICFQCGESFNRYVPPHQVSEKEDKSYCNLSCYHDSLRKTKDDTFFRLDTENYNFDVPASDLGIYSGMELSNRHRHTIKARKINHTFFQKGIMNEKTAYVYGIWLTDGHVALFKNGKNVDAIEVEYNSRGQKIIGSYIATLHLTDFDIIEKVAKVLENKNKIIDSFGRHKGKRTKNTKILHINSPYFHHDLVALGCGIRKTYYANYPLIPKELDRHFIRGVLDGDGSIQISKEGRLNIRFCGNDLLMYGIYLKLRQHLNITLTAISYPTEDGMTTFCEIRYGLQKSIAIRNWIYQDAEIFGERKHEKAFDYQIPMLFQTWSTRRLANYLGTSIYFIQENVHKHKLPHIMVGNVVSFQEENLPIWEDFLRKQLKNPRARFKNKEELIQRWGM